MLTSKRRLQLRKLQLLVRKTAREDQLYKWYHEALNHRTGAVDKLLIAGKLPGALKPLDFFCTYCSLGGTQNHPFSNQWNRQPIPVAALRPFQNAQIDTWGPIKVADRNSFEFIVDIIDEAIGATFL